MDLGSFCIVIVFLINACVARVAVINGDKAEPNEIPYQVWLEFHGYGHGCDGGIIHEEYILTAAHCAMTKDNHFHGVRMFIHAGTNNLKVTGEIAEVQKVFVPKEYNPKDINKYGDIAVMKLKRPLKLSKHVKKLELPTDKFEAYVNETARIAGFGWNWIELYIGKDHYSREKGNNTDGGLRYTDTFVSSNSDCQRGHPSRMITKKQICAQAHQPDALKPRGVCTGDSGSPLVYDGKTVIGILDASPWGCNEKDTAAIYTRVTQYLDIIKDALQNKVHKDAHAYEFS